MPWGQLSLSTDKANAFELSTVDEGPDGRVRFLTTAEITGASIADLPQPALCRMFCIYVVTHLSEKYLLDACHSGRNLFLANQRSKAVETDFWADLPPGLASHTEGEAAIRL